MSRELASPLVRKRETACGPVQCLRLGRQDPWSRARRQQTGPGAGAGRSVRGDEDLNYGCQSMAPVIGTQVRSSGKRSGQKLSASTRFQAARLVRNYLTLKDLRFSDAERTKAASSFNLGM
jgi:hypothetical protein